MDAPLRPLRILMITDEFPFGTPPRVGGGGAHVFYLVDSLAFAGHKVTLLTYSGASKGSPPFRRPENVNILPADFGGRGDPIPKGALHSGTRHCRATPPDVIHGHHVQGGFIGEALSEECHIPLVVTMHVPPALARARFAVGPAPDRNRALWRKLARSVIVERHVAYSQAYWAENLEAGVPKEKLRLIYHGVPVEHIKERSSRSRLPNRFFTKVAKEDSVIVCPMRPEKKGADYFVEAAGIVNSGWKGPGRLRFVVTGDPRRGSAEARQSAKRLKVIARTAGVQKSMLFMQFTLQQMWKLYDRSRLCVLPSLREGLSISLLEAMAVGVPVVAFEVHGTNEVVGHGDSGLLCSPTAEPKDLASAMAEILDDPALGHRLACRASDKVLESFDAATMARKHAELYREILRT